jgi:hypothetical protein
MELVHHSRGRSYHCPGDIALLTTLYLRSVTRTATACYARVRFVRDTSRIFVCLSTFVSMAIVYMSRSLQTTRTYGFLIANCLLFIQRVLGLRTCLVLLRPLTRWSAMSKGRGPCLRRIVCSFARPSRDPICAHSWACVPAVVKSSRFLQSVYWPNKNNTAFSYQTFSLFIRM